jgi:hypothetical protein
MRELTAQDIQSRLGLALSDSTLLQMMRSERKPANPAQGPALKKLQRPTDARGLKACAHARPALGVEPFALYYKRSRKAPATQQREVHIL